MPWLAVSVVQAELGVCLQLSRWMVIMGPRLGQRAVPSECSEVEGTSEGGQEGCALEGEGLGGGGAAAEPPALAPCRRPCCPSLAPGSQVAERVSPGPTGRGFWARKSHARSPVQAGAGRTLEFVTSGVKSR